MTTPDTTKPLTPRQIEALRYLAKYPHNPLRPDQVEAGTLGMLRRRGLVGRVVEGRGKGQRTTSPLTDAGRALLAALDAAPTLDAMRAQDAIAAPALWAVMMANHLHNPADPSDEPAYFVRDFPGATAAEAYAAAVAWAAEAGDCSPSGGVEDVEGPLWAAAGAVPHG